MLLTAILILLLCLGPDSKPTEVIRKTPIDFSLPWSTHSVSSIRQLTQCKHYSEANSSTATALAMLPLLDCMGLEGSWKKTFSTQLTEDPLSLV